MKERKSVYKKWLKAPKDEEGIVAYPIGKNKKSKGWRREPIRHGLASKGIRTSRSKVKDIGEMGKEEIPPEELYVDWEEVKDAIDGNLRDSYEYGRDNSEKLIKLFWWSSINNNWMWFDLDLFLELSHNTLKELVRESLHNNIDMVRKEIPQEEFKDREIVYSIWEKLDENWYSFDVDIFSKEEKNEMTRYTSGREDLTQLLLDMNTSVGGEMDRKEKIQMVDRVIHVEHMEGNIWDKDIHRIRKNFEEEYL